MPTSEEGNRPRWTGQPGFFEIWFLVVFDPAGGRAWWLRYTTFAPVRGVPRATLWAAAFDSGVDPPRCAVKEVHDAAAYRPFARDGFSIAIDGAELRNGACSGRASADGHTIAWSLTFVPRAHEAVREPWLLRQLPLPTRVSHANTDVRLTGWVVVDERRYVLHDAPGVQKHIWGTRRVEELLWLYAPRFTEDPAACLEATAVRLRRGAGPAVTPVWLRTSDTTLDGCGLHHVFRNRVEAVPDGITVRAASLGRVLTATARCDPRTLTGWVYRDPAGWDVYVAQSDVASCEVELRGRGEVRRLTAVHAAALEFHGPEPLPGVRYVPWEASGSLW